MSSFLEVPPTTPAVQALYDDDIEQDGYVMNTTRVWAWRPDVVEGLFGLMRALGTSHGLGWRERCVVVSACASALRDSYCSLAWGVRLADAADPELAAAVLTGTDEELTPAERALAKWARKVARGANATTAADVEDLRAAGYTDEQIFAITAFISLRIAFSTVNAALGAHPDGAFRQAHAPVVKAVTYGRPIAD